MNIKAPTGLRQWWNLYHLYHTAFPRSERKPFWLIRKKFREGKFDVWYFEEDNKFVGLAFAIIGEDGRILLDYFAVSDKIRSKGNGSRMLQQILKQYEGRDLFGEIEVEDPSAENNADRIRRKAFYLRNGLVEMGVRVCLFGVEMELLSNGCQMTFEEYLDYYCKNVGEFARENIQKR